MYKNKQINSGMCTCMAKNRQLLGMGTKLEQWYRISLRYPGTQTGNEANIHVNQ